MGADQLDSATVTAVVLAGGRGRRMGGEDKGLLPLRGRPMVALVAERLAPQVAGIFINANRNLDRYADLGFPVIKDRVPDLPGPLAGVLTALETAPTPLVLIAPCDTPDLPNDLVARLRQAMAADGAPLAVASDGEHLHPTVLLARRELAESVRACLAGGERKLGAWVRREGAAEADFSDNPRALLNINTPGQLAAAAPGERQAPAFILDLPLLGFVARSGTGKTTLLEKVIAGLHRQGMRVGLIKHTHHRFDIDRPGKDSYRLREAGALQVMVASRRRWALMTEVGGKRPEPVLAELLPHLSTAGLDLILVEGFKHEAFPKVELHRAGLGRPPLFPEDPHIVAVATDDPSLSADRPLMDINDAEAVTAFVLDFSAQYRRQDSMQKGKNP